MEILSDIQKPKYAMAISNQHAQISNWPTNHLYNFYSRQRYFHLYRTYRSLPYAEGTLP